MGNRNGRSSVDPFARATSIAALAYQGSHAEGDYEKIKNKPSLNGVVILGDKFTENYLLMDDSTIKSGTDHKLYVNIDNDKIFLNSEGKLTAKGIEVSEGNAINIEDDTTDPDIKIINVLYDGYTVELNSEGKLDVVFDEDTIFKDTDGKWKAKKLVNGIATEYIDSENKVNVLFDNNTITLNSEGKLQAVNLEAGEATEIDSESKINVLYDDSTIKLATDNKLYVPIDNDSIFIDTADNKIKAQKLSDGVANVIDSSDNHIDVKFDDITIKVNAANQLDVPIDYETIYIDSESEVAVKAYELIPGNGIVITENSEGDYVIDVQFTAMTKAEMQAVWGN